MLDGLKFELTVMGRIASVLLVGGDILDGVSNVAKICWESLGRGLGIPMAS